MTNISAEQLVSIANEKGVIETLYEIFGKNFSFSLPINQNINNLSLADLDLSVRSYNAFKRMDINNVKEFLDYLTFGKKTCVQQLLGRRSINEVKITLLKMVYETLSETEKLDFFKSVIAKNT